MSDISFLSLPKNLMIENNRIELAKIFTYSYERSETIRKFQNIIKNPNNFGIFYLELGDTHLYSQTFSLNRIEAIFSDGLEYCYNATYDSNLVLDLSEISSQLLETAYIYIAIKKNSELYFSLEEEYTYYKKGTSVVLKEQDNFLNETECLEPNAFLCVGETPPLNCSYIPIAKVEKENGKVVLSDFIPPLMNIHCDSRFYQMSRAFLSFVKKKLVLLNDSSLFVSKNDDLIFVFEWNNKKNILSQCILSLESMLRMPSIHPKEFYFECHKILSQICSLNYTQDLPKLQSYNHFNLLNLFQNLFSQMENILEQEVPEKYTMCRFNKKGNMYFLKLPTQNPKITYKIALKKPSSGNCDGFLEWMKFALICESKQFNSIKEKRALGFERKQDSFFFGMKMVENYLIFDIQNELSNYNEENILIIYQTSDYLNKFEPEEIVFCYMKD